ncbi:unnamed protein product [Ectocarpus fasciculatus]
MFVLATIKDTVKVAPSKFSGDALDVLTAQIEAKFADRVIANVGLCICLHSYESIGDPYVYPSDGAAHYKVRFRMLVFRPFVGEILTGKVSSCTKQGIKVSLDFFENASIPKDLLQSPSVFARGEWMWSYPDPDAEDGEGEGGGGKGGEGSGAENDDSFSLALHDEVRFRVRTLEFTQVTSTATGSLQATTVSTARGAGGASGGGSGGGRGGGAAGNGGHPPVVRERGTSVDLTDVEEAPSAMTITGSMNEEGLGLLSWWE